MGWKQVVGGIARDIEAGQRAKRAERSKRLDARAAANPKFAVGDWARRQLTGMDYDLFWFYGQVTSVWPGLNEIVSINNGPMDLAERWEKVKPKRVPEEWRNK